MTQPTHTSPAQARAQLYLVVPFEAVAGVDQPANELISIVGTIDVAACLLMLPPDGGDDATSKLRPFVTQLQSSNIAVMIADDVDQAAALGADGVHLAWRPDILTAYEQARDSLGDTKMIGADAGKSRHDAMLLGERGADYVAFGVPGHVKDQDTARKRQMNLIAWWAELFEVPVVAGDLSTELDIAEARNAGADFIAVTLPPHSAENSNRTDWTAQMARDFPSNA